MLDFFEEALNESYLCSESNDVPVGAVIVKDNVIIARGHNTKEIMNDPTCHAEINAIREACKTLCSWRLSDCDMYVTLEPCFMCNYVIREARLKNVFYLVERLDYKKPYNRTNVCVQNISDLSLKYKEDLKNFFQKNCNR